MLNVYTTKLYNIFSLKKGINTMEGYKKWVDGLGKGLRIVFAIFVSLIYFLYRLFNVIEEKAQNKDHLIYLILNVVPFVAIVVWVLDLVAAVKGAPVPLAFGKKDKKEQPVEEAKEVKEEKAE